MTDVQPPESDRHPVVMGLVALVAVGLVVGVLVSGGALAATRVLGLSGSHDTTGASSQQSMYIPKPVPTDASTGPAITLAPGETSAPPATTAPAPATGITLSIGQTAVSSLQRIDLTGVYPTGEGHIVQVQRLENGQWVDFATVDAAVSGSTFATYVQTSRSGLNQFRVRDTDSDAVSNEVDVQVS